MHLGKRKEARLCVAGLRELRCLRNVFTIYEFGTNLLIEAGELQCLYRRAPVRSVSRIGDGHLRNLGLQQASPLLRLWVAVCAGRKPQNKCADGVSHRASRLRAARLHQLGGELAVGGEEKIEGCAVLDLREQTAARTEDQFSVVS